MGVFLFGVFFFFWFVHFFFFFFFSQNAPAKVLRTLMVPDQMQPRRLNGLTLLEAGTETSQAHCPAPGESLAFAMALIWSAEV